MSVSASQKGSIGETLILSSDLHLNPLSEKIESRIEKEFSVGEYPAYRSSVKSAGYLQALTADGEEINWQPDGIVEYEWYSKEGYENVEKIEHGRPHPRQHDQSAIFPLEIKTGGYAEFERDQKEVAQIVASADNRVYPMQIQVDIDGLPDEFKLKTIFV